MSTIQTTATAPVAKRPSRHPVDEILPVPKLAAYGFQHVLAFYAGAVIVPILLLVAVFLVVRHRDWLATARLGVAVAGAIALYTGVKTAVGRPRPPSSLWIGRYTGGAFPSGHATVALAFYGMLALVLASSRNARTRVWSWAGVAVVVALVGASRMYLGAHWLTDVLGGYALGATWLAVVVAVTLVAATPARDREAEAEPGPRASGRRTAA